MAIRAIQDRGGAQQPVTAQDVQAVLQALQRAGKRNKYHAKAVRLDGIRHASSKEARRWHTLMLLLKAGKIRALVRQPEYELHAPSGEVLGLYRADARYEEPHGMDWRLVVEDTKGGKTLALARWKHKHMQAEYGITVREVR